jgi:hypothetical protein
MTQIIIDEPLLSRLHQHTEPLDLCSPDGRILGRFIPTLDSAQYLQPQISDEELQRRKASKEPGYTTTEVLAYLEQL